LPRQSLTDYEQRLTDLPICFRLISSELDVSHVCPHCGYKPASDKEMMSASTQLDDFECELDLLLEEWTRTLLANLEDSAIKERLSLIKPKQRKLIQECTEQQTLPDTLTQDFIQALQEVFSELQKNHN